jgi:hypothetical protein
MFEFAGMRLAVAPGATQRMAANREGFALFSMQTLLQQAGLTSPAALDWQRT